MPTFTIASPTGEEYDIEAPEGASQQQAFEFFKREHSAGRVKPRQDKGDKFYNDISRSFKGGLAGLGNTVDRGFSGLAGAIADVGGDVETRDRIFSEMKGRIKSRNEFAGDQENMGMFPGIVGKIPSMPGQILSLPLAHMSTGQEAIEAGESMSTAQKQQAVSLAGNAAAVAVPASMGVSLPTKAVTGAALNTANLAATSKINKELGETEFSKKKFTPSKKDYIEAGLLGTGFGLIGPSKPFFNKKAPAANPVLDNLRKAAAEPEVVKPVIEVPDLRLEHPIAADTRVKEMNRRQPSAEDYNNRDANVRVVEEEIAAMKAAEEAQATELAAQESARLNDFSMNAKQDLIDDTPYGDRPAQYGMTDTGGRLDENGIPIRADLSMEAQNVQDPLQMNLWGDELPGKANTLSGKSMTSALDTLPPGPARDLAISQLSGVGKSQRGAIDPEIFKAGFRNINRALSRLTDQPWVREAFPSNQFESNIDGTPKILLHGTKDAFNDQPRGVSYEGLHAGYGGAATLKAATGSKDGRVGYRERNLSYDYNGTKDANSAMYPVALRKGNYPRLDGDYGSWKPMKLADSRSFKLDLSKATKRGFYDIDDFMDSYKEQLKNKDLSAKEENLIFAKMLKNEFGIDGFFYPNKYETAQHQIMAKSGTMKSPQRARNLANKLGLEDSVVTYDDNNMVSLYDGQSQARSINSGMSRGQRGTLDFNETAKLIKQVVHGISKTIEQNRLPVSDREKLLQLGLRDDSFVLRPMETEGIVAKALTEQDSTLNKYTQSGAVNAGDKAKSTLVRETGRWMNWARSNSDKFFRERVKPVEQVLSSVSKADLETAMQTMQLEMFNKSRFSDEQLTRAGMSKEAMFARSKLMEAYSQGIATLNAKREKLGLRPVKEMEAYFSSQFNGDYLISVTAANGRPIGLATAATRHEANKALAWIKANVPEQESATIVDRRTSSTHTRTPRDVSSLYEGLMDVFKGTPMEAELRQMMEGHSEMKAYTERGFYNHFKDKTGVRFFIGDRPWLSDQENAVQGAQAQIKYLKDLYNWIPTQEAMAQLKGVFTDEQLMRSQPNNVAFAKASMDNYMGISTSITRPMEDFIAGGVAKVSTGELSKYVATLKSLTYVKQLGASVGYAIATPLQMLLYAPSYHNMLSGEGIKHNPINTMAKTLRDVNAILLAHSGEKVGVSMQDKILSPFSADALRYMEDNGIITKSLYDEYAQLGTHKAVDMVNQTLGSTITAPDKLARLLGFMSFAHHMKDGKAAMSDMEIFRRAAELTDKAAVPLERHNRPLLADKLGLAGELAFMYKAPAFMAFNNLLELGKHAHNTGNTKPLIMALGATMLLGGGLSLPGVHELDTGFELLKDLNAKFGSKDLAIYLKDKGVKQSALEHLPDWATYGVLSAASNTQLASRFGNEAVNLQDPLGGLVPSAQVVGEAVSSTWGLLTKPDYTQLQQSAHTMGLPLTKGLQESYGDEFTAGDMNSKRSVLRPSDIRGQETIYARNEADQSRRKLGLMSLDESKARDIDYRSRQDEKRMVDVRNRAVKEFFFNAMKQQDTAGDVITFLEAGGEPDELMREFDTRIQKRSLTPDVRELIKADKLREIQAIVQKMKMGRQYAN